MMEDLVRKACALVMQQKRLPEELSANEIFRAINALPHLDFLTNHNMAVTLDTKCLSNLNDESIT